jgi:hypothetical protein
LDTKESGLENNADYTVTFNLNKDSSFFVTHKNNWAMFDGNFSLWQQDLRNLTLFTSLTYDNKNKGKENAEEKLDSRFALRYRHNNNQVFTLGLDKFNLYKNSPTTALVSYLHGGEVAPGKNVYGGYQLGFNFSNKSVASHNFLVAYKEKNLLAFGEVAMIKNESGYDKNYSFRANSKVNENLNFLGKITYGPKKIKDEKKNEIIVQSLDAELVGEYNFGEGTKLKGRIANDNSLTLGLLHNYNKLVNFGFVTKVN